MEAVALCGKVNNEVFFEIFSLQINEFISYFWSTYLTTFNPLNKMIDCLVSVGSSLMRLINKLDLIFHCNAKYKGKRILYVTY